MKLILTLCLLVLPAFAQEPSEQARINQWRGLVIDQSTPDDAIKLLGKPKEDKIDRFKVYCLDSRIITKQQERKIYRYLKFDAPDMKFVEMAFHNNVLIMLLLKMNTEVKAAALSNIYGTTFSPWYRQRVQIFEGGSLKRDNGTVYAKEFPSEYGLVASDEHVLIGAHIINTHFLAVPGDAAFPGKVYGIQIISRRYENKDGSDVLK